MKNLHLAHFNNQFEFEIAQEKRLVNMPPAANQRPRRTAGQKVLTEAEKTKHGPKLKEQKKKLEDYQKKFTEKMDKKLVSPNPALNAFKKTAWGKKAMEKFWGKDAATRGNSEFSKALKTKIGTMTALTRANTLKTLPFKKRTIERAARNLILAKMRKAQAFVRARKSAIKTFFDKASDETGYMKRSVKFVQDKFLNQVGPKKRFKKPADMIAFVNKIAIAQKGSFRDKMKLAEHGDKYLFDYHNENAGDTWDKRPKNVYNPASGASGTWLAVNIEKPLKESITQALKNPENRSSVLTNTQGAETTTYSEEGRTNERANNATNVTFVKSLIAKLNKNEPVYIALTGYTSLDGAQNVNRSLGQRRAAAKRQAILTLLRQAPPKGLGQVKVAQLIREKKIRFTMRHKNREISATTGIKDDVIAKINSENNTPNARMNAMIKHLLKGNDAFKRVTGGQVIAAYNRYSALLRNPKTADQAAVYFTSKPYFQGNLGQNLMKFLRTNVAKSRGAGMESLTVKKFRLREAVAKVASIRVPSHFQLNGPVTLGDDRVRFIMKSPGTGQFGIIEADVTKNKIQIIGTSQAGFATQPANKTAAFDANLGNLRSKFNSLTQGFVGHVEKDLKKRSTVYQANEINKAGTEKAFFTYKKQGQFVEVKAPGYSRTLSRINILKFHTSGPAVLRAAIEATTKRVSSGVTKPIVSKFLKKHQLQGVSIVSSKLDRDGTFVAKVKKGDKEATIAFAGSEMWLKEGAKYPNTTVAKIKTALGITPTPVQASAVAAAPTAPNYSPRLLRFIGRAEGSLKSYCQRFRCKFTKMENGHYVISKTINRAQVPLGEIKISTRGGVTVQYYAGGGRPERTIKLRRFSASRVVRSLSNRA